MLHSWKTYGEIQRKEKKIIRKNKTKEKVKKMYIYIKIMNYFCHFRSILPILTLLYND